MDQLSRGTISESDRVSDLQVLQERLRTMTVDQILQELDELTEQAENIGEELDPHIVLIYYDIMDELAPISVPKFAKAASKKHFAVDYPEYMGVQTERKYLQKPNKILGHLCSRRAVVAAALLVAFAFSGVVAALEVPQSLITWAEKTFSIGAMAGSEMRLEVPTEDGFYTLDDALHYYGISTYTPQWIPARFQLDDIAVSENESWISFIAVFSPLDGSTDSCVIKITSYDDTYDPPDITYEDNGVENREIREVGNLTFQITNNMELDRITCKSSNHMLSILGNFSTKEVDQIIEHITQKGE